MILHNNYSSLLAHFMQSVNLLKDCLPGCAYLTYILPGGGDVDVAVFLLDSFG